VITKSACSSCPSGLLDLLESQTSLSFPVR
jgi:hypothetical protein